MEQCHAMPEQEFRFIRLGPRFRIQTQTVTILIQHLIPPSLPLVPDPVLNIPLPLSETTTATVITNEPP